MSKVSDKYLVDLFSGIGGFSLGLERAGLKTVVFCEQDKFCQKVLNKNFPGVPIINDIHEFRKICKRSGRVCNRILHTGNSESLQNNTAGDVEDTEKKGMYIQKQSSFWEKEPFLQGDEGFGQGAESLGTGNRGRENTAEKDLRAMRGFGDIQERDDKNTSSSPGLQQAARCNVAVPEMPPQMARGECPYNGDCLNERPFMLTAGTPCQPASCAGKRRGTKDDRWLWGETFRVIAELQPKWCILENVRGLLTLEGGLVFDNLLSELENLGYETRTFCLPACAVNAPHRRDRVWIVAHSLDKGCIRRSGGSDTDINGIQEGEQTGYKSRSAASRCDEITITDAPQRQDNQRNGRSMDTPERSGECSDSAVSVGDKYVTDTKSRQRLQGHENESIRRGRKTREECGGCIINVSNSEGERLEGSVKTDREQGQKSHDELLHGCCGEWDEPWFEVAQRFCQLDARISNRLDGCLTLPETHGIMGFILMLRRYHYATSEETRTREVLPILREAFGEKSVQRCFGRLSEIFEAENLWCPVHGKMDGEREENKIGISEGSCEVPRESVREMRDGKEYRNPSQGRRLDKQCTCKFDDIVYELSSEIALGEWKRNSKKAENILFDLWKESRGERFLYEPLPALYEIWRSVTDQEIGAFRRHYNMRDKDRVNRLKSLGNAVVPQIPEIIGRVIMEIENESK